jgi:hypothetical protein
MMKMLDDDLFGGGGGGVSSLELIERQAKKKRVGRLFRSADTSFSSLFALHSPCDGGSVFAAFVGTDGRSNWDQLLFLDVERSNKKNGLLFRIKLESMAQYLKLSATEPESFRRIFPLTAGWQSGFPTGWFTDTGAINQAADALGARLEETRR